MAKKLTTEEFIANARKSHGSRFDYSLVEYKNTKAKVKIICHEHGVFLQSPTNHYINGCKLCSNNEIGNRCRLSKDRFIEISNKKHNSVYNYDKVDYKSILSKVIITCSKHGDFEQLPNNHMKGHGCKKCGEYLTHKKRWSDRLSDFIEKSKVIHGNNYDYSCVDYVNIYKNVKIKCNKHNSYFMQSPMSHIRGSSGCRICSKLESNGERRIRTWLENKNIHFEREKKFNSCKIKTFLRFDFYIPSDNLLIEFDGEQHFNLNLNSKYFKITQKNVDKIKIYDEFKNVWAKENGFSLLRIPYTEIKNIDQILTNFLLKESNVTNT